MVGQLKIITRQLVTIAAAFLLAACASHDGMYSPSCAAYAGSNIELSGGHFVWGKFTDSVVIGDDGNVVNQFPGYPLVGSYRVDGESIFLESTSGDAVATMYLLQHDDRSYLLTAEQRKDWERAGKLADCALVLGGNRKS
jgi:hypothetical protein